MTDWLDVSDTTPVVSYTVGGAPQSAFTVPFVFFSDSELDVFVTDTKQTLNVDYFVSGALSPTGGTVTLAVAQSNVSVVIARNVPVALSTHIPTSGPLDVPGINLQFSKLVAMLQEERSRFVTLAALSSTSPTSNTIGVGSKTFATQAGKSYIAGQTLAISSAANPTNSMGGQVTAYNAVTGSLTANVTSPSGAGTFADWLISVVSSPAPFAAPIRERLTVARTYFVRSDGNNNNTGLTDSAAGAFLTIQRAVDVICETLDIVGAQVTIQLQQGVTFNENISLKNYVSSGLTATQNEPIIRGDPTSFATAASYTLNCGSGIGIGAVGLETRWRLVGFTIRGTDATHGTCVQADFGSSKIYIGQNMRFGLAKVHRSAINGGKLEQLVAPVEIFGGAQTSIVVSGPGSGYIEQDGASVTFTGTPAWASSYLSVADGGGFLARSTTRTGTATGIRWQADSFSCIDVVAGSQGLETVIETALAGYGSIVGGYQIMTGTGNSVRATGPTLTSAVFNGCSGDVFTLTGGQLVFPASQNASANANTLDDYEEGTWTPTLTFATTGNLTVVYATQAGTYVKIGKMVTAWFAIQTSTFTHTTAAGNQRITGLPFTVDVAVEYRTQSLVFGGITKANYTQFVPNPANTQTYLEITASGSAQAVAQVAVGDTPSGTNQMRIGCVNYNA